MGRFSPGSGLGWKRFAAALLVASSCAVARPKVLVIGVDGLRPDQLGIASTPAVDELVANGAIALDATNAWTPDETWNGHSATNWGVLLTGVSPELSGLTQNGDAEHTVSDDGWLETLSEREEDLHSAISAASLGAESERPRTGEVVPTVFGRLKHRRHDSETGCFNTWPGIGVAPGTVLGSSRSAVDCFFSPANDDGARSSAERDRDTIDAAVEALTGAGRFGGADVDLTFVHLSQCDAAGHAGDYASEPYRASIEAADALIGELLDAIDARATRREEQWLVIVTTDHGGRSDAGEHADNTDPLVRTIPLIVSADGILPNRIDLSRSSLYDVAPTVLAWLGLPLDEAMPGTPRARR